jgi:DUF917 family protein
MNREQKRAAVKGVKDEEISIANVLLILTNGNVLPLRPSEIEIVDKNTGKPITKHKEAK